MSLSSQIRLYLNKLMLKNLKQHKNTVIEFKKGKNAIIGPNGAGKSTVFDGIMFAFFGVFPKDKTSFGEYIRNDLLKKRFFEIELYFTLSTPGSNVDYKVWRKWKSKSTEASLENITTGEPVADGQNSVTKEILTLLNMEKPDTFNNIIMASQAEIAGILSLKKGERKKFFEKLLCLNEIAEAERASTRYLKEQSKEIGKEADLDEKITTSSKELKDQKTREKEEQKRLGQLQKELKEINTQKRKKEREFYKINTLMLRLGDLETEVKENEDHIMSLAIEEGNYSAELEKNTLGYKFKDLTKKKAEEKTGEIEREIKENRKQSKDKEILINDANQILGKIATQARLVQSIKLEIDAFNSSIENVKQSVSKDEMEKYSNFEECDERIEEYNKIQDICTGEDAAQYNINASKYESVQEELKNNEIELEKYDPDKKYRLKKSTDIKKTLQALGKKIEAKNHSIQEIQEQIGKEKAAKEAEQERKEKLQDVEETCPLCESPISADTHNALLERAQRGISDAEKRITALDKKIRVEGGEIQSLQEESDLLRIILPKIELLEKDIKELSKLDKEQKRLSKQYEGSLKEFDFQTELITISEQKSLQEVCRANIRIIGKIRDYLKLKTDLDEKKASLKTNEKALAKLEAEGQKIDLPELQKVKDSLDEKYDGLNEIKNLLGRYIEITDSIRNIKGKIDKKQEEIQTLSDQIDEEKFSKLREEIDMLKNQEGHFEGEQKVVVNQVIPALHNDIARIESELATLKEQKAQLGELQKQIAFAQQLHDVFQIYRPLLLSRKIKSINDRTTELFTKFFSNSGFNEIKINPSGQLDIVRDGHPYRSENLSGGEKTICGLALRIAIVKTLADYGILMLDEPTDALDEENREILLEFLENQIPIDQTIFISHYDPMRQAADHIIEIK